MKKLLPHLLLALLVVGCSPITYTHVQSAKQIEKGKLELTPLMTIGAVAPPAKIGVGISTAYGLSEKYNLIFRFEKINYSPFLKEYDDDNSNDTLGLNILTIFNPSDSLFNYINFGLKYNFWENKEAPFFFFNEQYSSFLLPVSFTKANGNKNILTFIEPALIHTFANNFNEGILLELTSSIKFLIPIYSNYKYSLMAWNVGLGFSFQPSKWIFRTNGGILQLIHKHREGIAYEYNFGFSFYPF